MTTHPDRWSRLGTIFDAALHLEPGARAAYVAHAAAGDTGLEREVLSLLAAHSDADEFLNHPATSVRESLLGETDAVFQPGSVAGPYLIRKELGHGGMGQVYLADDTRLHRSVALKVLDPRHLASDSSRQRLRLEARAAARLKHPGIAGVYVLEDIDGLLCLAVEHVEGRTLRERLDEAVPPLGEAVRLAVSIASGLEAAHQGDVVHRDLKPENIMVDERGATKILDFGIALLDGPDAGSDPRLTEAGAVLGTPAYMSPEQLQGHTVDFRTDLFSFGIVLYELLTGVHPFLGPTRTSTQARILTVDPAPIARFVHTVPAALEAILRRCLEKRPADRYQATTELVEALSQVQAGLGDPRVAVPAAPRPAVSPDGRATARAWWRVHQFAVMAAVSGMLIAAGWVAYWIGGAIQYPLFLGLLACGVAATTFRAHLLFVLAHYPDTMPVEVRRVMPWLRVLDVAFGVTSAVAALAIGPTHPVASSFFLATAAIVTVAVLIIEPTTVRSAFAVPAADEHDRR